MKTEESSLRNIAMYFRLLSHQYLLGSLPLRSLSPPHDRLQTRQRSVDLDPLKRQRRVDVLRADGGALPHERAVEGPRVSCQEVEPLLRPRLRDRSCARQPRGAVYQRPAAPADSHPARPSEGERPVKPVARVVECIQDEHLRMVLYYVLLVEAVGCSSREVPLDPYRDLLWKGGVVSTFFQWAATSSG